jgi:hypothetical protein
MTKDNDAQARARSQRPTFSIAIWRIISTPILKYWCALNTTSPGQSRGRAGASLLTASPTVPACRPAYAAATCHWATRDRHTAARLILCDIAHAHQLSTGFCRLWAGSTVADRHPNQRAEPIARRLSLIARGRARLCDAHCALRLPMFPRHLPSLRPWNPFVYGSRGLAPYAMMRRLLVVRRRGAWTQALPLFQKAPETVVYDPGRNTRRR